MTKLFKPQHIQAGVVVLVVSITVIALGISQLRRVDSPEPVFDESVLVLDGLQVRLLQPDSSEKGTLIFLEDKTDAATAAKYPRLFAEQGYDVLAINSEDLLLSVATDPGQCIDISARLLNTRKLLAEKRHIDVQSLPVVVGNGLGAALAYVAVGQAPAGRFHAAVSVNFTPQLRTGRPLCSAEQLVVTDIDGMVTLAPLPSLPTSWYVFQDTESRSQLAGQEFTDNIRNAKLTLRKQGDEPVVSSVVQILQWLDPRLTDQTSSDSRLGGLPLIKVAAEPGTQSPLLAIMLTGDGGWAEIDKGIAAGLANRGIPTVVLDSLSYFWNRKTPEEAARDIETVITEYLAEWDKNQVILVGYSFGADVLPVIANRLSEESRNRIALIALLGIGQSAAFEFHLSSWLHTDDNLDRLPLLPEMEKLAWANTLCIYGTADREAHCASFEHLGVKVIAMQGDHHFDAQYGLLVQHMLDSVTVSQGVNPR